MNVDDTLEQKRRWAVNTGAASVWIS